jgi:hypothetical protein
MRNPLYKSKSYFSGWNLAKISPKKKPSIRRHCAYLLVNLPSYWSYFKPDLFMWKLTFILCENCTSSNVSCTKKALYGW